MTAPNPARRNAHARRAILDATVELITRHGYAQVSMVAIAATAGVGKQTIYRWWPSKAALALEALNDYVGDTIDFHDTGDIAVDLSQQLGEVVSVLNSPIGAVFRGVVAEAQSDPTIGLTLLDTIIEPRTQACEARLAKAIEVRQLRADVPTRVMVELIYAPMYSRLLLGTDRLTVPGIMKLFEYTLSGLRPVNTSS